MNKDLLETQWPQIREMLKEKFSNLTEEDIRQINGRYDQLVAKLQQKYGYTREEAEERVRSWNFDRFSSPRSQMYRDEKLARREEDNSSFFKWLLALGIPLILLGAYFLGTRTPEPTTSSPTFTQQQAVLETPADRFITNSLRETLLSQPNLSAAVRNIQITTQNGVVTLSGPVPSAEARNAIINTAENSAGVRQVVNNLQIR